MRRLLALAVALVPFIAAAAVAKSAPDGYSVFLNC